MMTKYRLISLMRSYGDAIITTREESFLATIDFSTAYVKNKRRKYFTDFKLNVLVFSWNHDKHIMLKPSDVLSVQPLAKVLNNVREDSDEQKDYK